MPRRCTICGHVERRQIDRHLVVRSLSFRDIARQYDVSKDAVSRHRKACLPSLLARAYEAEETERADELVKTARGLLAKAVRILQEAENRRDWSTALAGIREARGCLSLLAEIEGEIDRSPVVNINLSPEWLELRALIVRALDQHPEAKHAVIQMLSERSGVRLDA